MKKIITTLFLISSLVVGLFGVVGGWDKIRASASWAGGDILIGRNLTAGETTNHDPVSAATNDTVRLELMVINSGDQNADNTNVVFNLSNPTSPTATITGGGSLQTDTLGITPSGASLQVVAGSGLKYGPGCTSGCSIPDSVVGSGVNLGTVIPGNTNSYQVYIDVKVIGQPGGTQRAEFKTGNIFDGGDRTLRLVGWEDPISADPGDTVEFRFQAINTGTVTANNVVVKAQFPSDDATSIVTRAFVSAGNADTVSDTATVNVSGGVGQKIFYLPCQVPDFRDNESI